MQELFSNGEAADTALQPDGDAAVTEPLRQLCSVESVEWDRGDLHFPAAPVRHKSIDKDFSSVRHTDPLERLAQRTHKNNLPEVFYGRFCLIMFAQPFVKVLGSGSFRIRECQCPQTLDDRLTIATPQVRKMLEGSSQVEWGRAASLIPIDHLGNRR